MSSIFEIQQSYFELLSQVEENEGVMPEGLEEALMANEDDLNIKLENILNMIHHWEGGIATIDLEINRLSNLKKSKLGSINSLKEAVSTTLQSRGIPKMDLGKHKISFRKSEGVVVTDPTTIPSDFIKSKTTESIDKTSLKKWLKNGNEVTGAYLEERQNIQIK